MSEPKPVVVDITDAAWKARLIASRGKTAQAILDHGKLIAEFYDTCESASGGSTFTEKMRAWLGYSPDVSSRWKSIGDNYNELLSITQKLPNDWYSISLIAKLPPEDREGISPKITQAEVKKKVSEATRPADPKPERVGWTVAVERIIGQLPTRFSRGELSRSTAGRSEIRDMVREQYGRDIPRTVEADSAEAHALADAVRRCIARVLPKEAAARVEQEHAAVMAEVATLPESAKAKFERLVKKEHEILRARYFIEMEAAVRANTAKEKADYLEASAATHKACEAWKAKMRNLNDWMTREEFKLVLGCLHPDRQTDEEARRRFGRAFDIFNRLKVYAEGWQ